MSQSFVFSSVKAPSLFSILWNILQIQDAAMFLNIREGKRRLQTDCVLWFVTTLWTGSPLGTLSRGLGSHKMGAPSHPRAGPCRGEMSSHCLAPAPLSFQPWLYLLLSFSLGRDHSVSSGSTSSFTTLLTLCSLPRKSFSPVKIYATPSLKPAPKAAVSGAPSPISFPPSLLS